MSKATAQIDDFGEADRDACAQILANLPEWFGVEEVNRAYIEILGRIPTAVARVDRRVVGFIALEQSNPKSIEVHVMATDRTLHNRGIGSLLMNWAKDYCHNHRTQWLHVKTRGPSTPDPYYAKTRAFYFAKGFDALFESLTLWGPTDAALILVRKLETD